MEVLTTIAVFAVSFMAVHTVNWLVEALSQSDAEAKLGAEQIVDYDLLSAKDVEMAKATGALINSTFGDSATEAILKLSQEERVQAMAVLITELSELYGIVVDKIVFDQEGDPRCSGGYSFYYNRIQLDVSYLLASEPRYVHEFLDTVVHELRHAVQFKILDGQLQWDLSAERQEALLCNFLSYCDEQHYGVRAYMEQPMEQDAFSFAQLALREVK